jgi:uncharacterized Tic20 family protein
MTSSNPSNSFLGTDQAPAYSPTSDERTLAILCHVLAIFFWIIPPLIIYLIKKDESKFVAEHAKESLNFQLTVSIIFIVLFISIIGIFLLWILGVLELVLIIVAAVKASESKLYRYPFALRLIK